MVKSYTFKLDDRNPAEAALIRRIEEDWRGSGYTIRQAVSTALAAYHGLEIPRPSAEVFFMGEIKRLNERVELLEKGVAEVEDTVAEVKSDNVKIAAIVAQRLGG